MRFQVDASPPPRVAVGQKNTVAFLQRCRMSIALAFYLKQFSLIIFTSSSFAMPPVWTL